MRHIEEQRLFTALDDEADGILVLDRDRSVVWFNRTLQCLLGVRPEDVRGEGIAAFLCGYVAPLSPEQASVREVALDLQDDRSVRRLPVPVRTRSGALLWLSIAHDLSAISAGTDRAVLRFRDSTEDMTARFFRVAIDHSPVTVFAQDEELRYLWSYNQQLGFSDAEAIGKRDNDLFLSADAARLTSLKARVLATGEVIREEVTVTVDGAEHVRDITLEPIRDADGRIAGVSGTSFDITDRVRAEERYRESAENLSLLLRNARDVIYRIDLVPERRYSYISPAVTVVTGYTPEEHYADPDIALKIVHPDDLPLLQATIRGEIPYDRPLILRLVRRDGKVIWTEQQNTPIYDEDGTLVAVEGIARDITERKMMEEALRASEERYRFFLQNFQGIAFRADLDFAPIFCYGAVERITGYTEEEFCNDPGHWYRMIHPDDLPHLAETSRKLRTVPGYATEREYRIVRKDGKVRWVREMIRNVTDSAGVPTHVQGAVYDITEQKRVEQELRESEERFRSIFEGSGVGILLVDPEGRIARSNPAFQRMLGYTEDELAGMNICEITYPEDLPATLALYERLAKKRSGSETLEKRYITKDGRVIWGSKTVTYLRSPEGRPLRTISVVEDITGRKRIEEALRASEGRFRSIFEESPIGIEYYDADGRLIDVNPATLHIFGVQDPAEVRGFDLFADPNLPEEELLRLKQGEAVHFTTEFDFDIVRAHGLYRTSRSGRRHLDILVTGISRADESRLDGYVVLVSDITDRMRAENLRQEAYEQIEQNIEQFAILGDHVRQPLQVILGVVDLEGNVIEGKLAPSSDTMSHLYVYNHRPDVFGIAHTHSYYATAFAAVGKTVPAFITAVAENFGSEIPLGAYVPIGGEEIGAEIVKSIGDSTAIIMKNHGVFTVGPNAEKAVKAAILAEGVAKTYWLALQVGEPFHLSEEEVNDHRHWYKTSYGQH